MGLFESGYKVATRTELERATRELEELAKKEKETQTELNVLKMKMDSTSLLANIKFAEEINLIDSDQAREYQRRAMNARHEFLNAQTPVQNEISYNSNRQGMNMEEAEAQILQERAVADAQQRQNEQNRSSAQTRENLERMK